MQQFITSIIATICLLTLVIYDLLNLLRIIKKERWAKKIWEYTFPSIKYDEKILFLLIRPVFLTVSLMTYVLSGGVLSQIFVFNILLMLTPLLSLAVVIVNNTRE